MIRVAPSTVCRTLKGERAAKRPSQAIMLGARTHLRVPLEYWTGTMTPAEALRAAAPPASVRGAPLPLRYAFARACAVAGMGAEVSHAFLTAPEPGEGVDEVEYWVELFLRLQREAGSKGA